MEKPYYNTILDRFFEILELPPSSTFEEVKRKYHELAFKYHPDLNPEKEDEMKAINEAYSVLKNNESRIKYVKKYGVYTNNTYLNGKTYKQEELEKIKESLINIKSTYKEQLNKERNNSLKQRFKENYNLLIEDDYLSPTMEKGIRITYAIGLEFLYQLRKLKYQKNDNITKYTIRNRKTLAGILIATMLFNPIGVKKEQPKDTTTITTTQETENKNESSSLLINKQLIIKIYKPTQEDTIESISKKFNVPEEKIIKENNIKYNIKEKSTLKIPYYIDFDQLEMYTTTVNINEFDNLEDIAELYDTDLRTIISLNIKSFEYIDGKYTLITDIIIVPDFEKIDTLAIEKTYTKK